MRTPTYLPALRGFVGRWLHEGGKSKKQTAKTDGRASEADRQANKQTNKYKIKVFMTFSNCVCGRDRKCSALVLPHCLSSLFFF